MDTGGVLLEEGLRAGEYGAPLCPIPARSLRAAGSLPPLPPALPALSLASSSSYLTPQNSPSEAQLRPRPCCAPFL